MITSTAVLEHPGALRVRVIAVAPTEATFPIYQAIAAAMKNPGNGSIKAEFKDGSIILDVELHTEEHVDHLADIAAGAKQLGKGIIAEVEELVGAVVDAIKGPDDQADGVKDPAVCTVASPANNAGASLVGHVGPGPNEDHTAHSETSQPSAADLDAHAAEQDIAAATAGPGDPAAANQAQQTPPATPAAEPPPGA